MDAAKAAARAAAEAAAEAGASTEDTGANAEEVVSACCEAECEEGEALESGDIEEMQRKMFARMQQQQEGHEGQECNEGEQEASVRNEVSIALLEKVMP